MPDRVLSGTLDDPGTVSVLAEGGGTAKRLARSMMAKSGARGVRALAGA